MPSTAAIQGSWTLQSTDNAFAGRVHDGAFLLQANASNPNATWRSGVIPSVYSGTLFVDFLVVQQASPNMSVIVGPGSAVLSRAGQGPYVAYSTANATLTVATSDPVNPRIDLVYVQVLDSAVGDSSTVAQVGIVTGTPAASPTVPSLPATGVSIALAQIAVAANATQITSGNITIVRKSAGLRGGLRPMMEGDALADVGYTPGELRSRYSSSYGLTLIDYWGTDSAWHGTRNLELSTVLGSSSSLAAGTRSFLTLSIPDPGWAYQIKTMIAFHGEIGSIGATGYTITGNLDSTSGTQITGSGGYTSGATTDGITNPAVSDLNIPVTGLSATQTGAHTVYLTATQTGTGTANLRAWAGTTLNCTVVPV